MSDPMTFVFECKLLITSFQNYYKTELLLTVSRWQTFLSKLYSVYILKVFHNFSILRFVYILPFSHKMAANLRDCTFTMHLSPVVFVIAQVDIYFSDAVERDWVGTRSQLSPSCKYKRNAQVRHPYFDIDLCHTLVTQNKCIVIFCKNFRKSTNLCFG